MIISYKQSYHRQGRFLIPMLILLALPIAAMIAFILYHHKANLADKQPPVATSDISFGGHNWPVFRGNRQLTGCAEGQLPDTLKLAWKFKTDGEILSTPVIAGDRVFVTSMDEHLYALDLKTGNELWQFAADDELEASPLYYEGSVYFGSGNGVFYALEAASGTVRWTFDKAGQITGSANIAFTADNVPLIIFGSYDNHLYGLDIEGNKVLDVQAGNYINGSVAVDDGTVFFGSCDAYVYCVPLADPNETETIDAESYVAASCAVADGVVYAGNYDGRFMAADISTQDILWEYNETDGAFFSSPAVGESVAVVGCRDSLLYCFDRQNGNVYWTFEATDNFDSCPVICGNKVAIGNDDGRLYLVDLTTGQEVFSYTLGSSVTSSPAIAQNYLLIGSGSGEVYAFTAP